MRADSSADSSETYIETLKASIASDGFSDQLTAQLASSYPGLVITVRYSGQTCAGDPCGIGGSCIESSEAGGDPVRVCTCRASYSLSAAKNSCTAVRSREGSSWRGGLGDASALCWAVPPYVQLGDITGAGVWAELWRDGLGRLKAYFALALSDMPKAAQGQDLWVLAVLRLLLLLPLRLRLDRMTRSPNPQPAQYKFILSNDHLSDEIQELLQLRLRGGGGKGAGHVTHKFKIKGGQGGWRMVHGKLALSHRFETGAVGEDIHYITAATIPQLQHQFHKRLQLPTKTAWPESRIRLAVLTEPERPAELKHPLDENDPAVGRTDPEEDNMSGRQEPDAGISLADWAGWGFRELTTLEGLKPAPVVHRLAVNVGLPYDTELAVPRRGGFCRVWIAAAGVVCLVCWLSLGLAAAKIEYQKRGELAVAGDDTVGVRTVRILSMISLVCTAAELSAFVGWLVWLRQHGVVPPSAEFPRPPRRCCCGKRGAVSVRPEPAAVATGPTSSTVSIVSPLASIPIDATERRTRFGLPPPPKGWRGLWGGVALYEWAVHQQRKLRWISCALLFDVAASTALFISLGYCAGGVNQDELGSDSQSGSGNSSGVLCWVVPPGLVSPLTPKTILKDWAAEGWGSGGDGYLKYETTTAQGDLVLLAMIRALMLLVLLTSGAGMRVPDTNPKPRSKLVKLLMACLFKGLLKGCGCGNGTRDEEAIIAREVLKRKREDTQGVPRWRKQRWWLLLGWGSVMLFLLLIKLAMIAGWGGCGEDEVCVFEGCHRPHSFMEHRCETVAAAGGAAGLAFGNADDAAGWRSLARPFDLRGAPNVLLLGYTVCIVGFLEVIGLLGMAWRLDQRPQRVVPEQDALRRALLELIEDTDDGLGEGGVDSMNDDSAAARRVSRWLLALEVSGVLEDGGPALFDWMESILPKDASIVPVRYVMKEARERIKRKQHKQSERDRMTEAKLSVQERASALLKGELDPGDADGGHVGLGSGSDADVHQANSGWRRLEHTWGKYLSYHVSADRYSAPWSAPEHTVLSQLAGDRSLTWKQKAARLQELVSGAPRRSPSSVKRRWIQLERLANQAGWRCAESGTYRVAGWANDSTGEWMWEYPLDTAG